MTKSRQLNKTWVKSENVLFSLREQVPVCSDLENKPNPTHQTANNERLQLKKTSHFPEKRPHQRQGHMSASSSPTIRLQSGGVQPGSGRRKAWVERDKHLWRRCVQLTPSSEDFKSEPQLRGNRAEMKTGNSMRRRGCGINGWGGNSFWQLGCLGAHHLPAVVSFVSSRWCEERTGGRRATAPPPPTAPEPSHPQQGAQFRCGISK